LKLPPVNGPVTSAPAKTVAPSTNGTTDVGTRACVVTPRITKPSKPVYPASIANARARLTLGTVAPIPPTSPRSHRNVNAAAIAPRHWAIT